MIEPTVVLLALAALAFLILFLRERLRSRDEARALFERWSRQELSRIEAELSRSLELRSDAALERFRLENERRIRDDAVRRSQAAVSGKTTEQLVPFHPDFPFDPKDARFLGSPIDLVVFDGLAADELREIVFVEVKTGPAANLSRRERRIRDAIEEGRVRFREIRCAGPREPRHGSLFLPLRTDASEPSGQLEIADGGSTIRYWSDWSEPPLVYPLAPDSLVCLAGDRWGLKLATDGALPYLVLEDDVRVVVDGRSATLSVQFGDDGVVSYVLETERLVNAEGGTLLALDGRR
jgi:predicted Holliday junction resolvase-like endonuclease